MYIRVCIIVLECTIIQDSIQKRRKQDEKKSEEMGRSRYGGSDGDEPGGLLTDRRGDGRIDRGSFGGTHGSGDGGRHGGCGGEGQRYL